MKKITDFHEAWHFLSEHPVFKQWRLLPRRKEKSLLDDLLDTHMPHYDSTKPRFFDSPMFSECICIDVVKVNPETNSIDDDSRKNTAKRVWLQCGPWVNQNSNELRRWERTDFPHGTFMCDTDLDCGAPTFEMAIIQLANLVLEKYGDYESEEEDEPLCNLS